MTKISSHKIHEVKMDDIDEQLKTNIRSILSTIPEETINGIILAVKYAGLETLSDLQFVQEEDLILVLKPIQRRKLIKAWSEQSISRVKLLSHVPLKKCKWKKQKHIMLLQIYAKYKKELTCPDNEKHEVWRKIAEEVRQKCSLNCDELICMDKIEELKSEYERLKKTNVICKKKTGFYFEAQNAFENIENSDTPAVNLESNLLLKKCRWKRKKRLLLLQVYTKYKTELACPDTVKEEVWRKIADEIKERSSLNCDGLRCMNKIEELRHEYETLKKKNSFSNAETAFFCEADNAFGNIQNSDIPNSPVNETKKVGKYVPPHLRNEGNKSESIIISKIEDKPFTIKVSNLSKDVKESDLRELFTPYGTIARIYIIKDAVGQLKGFAFIKFHKTEDAARAIEAVNGIEYNKLILKVGWAQKTEQSQITDNVYPVDSIKVINRIPSIPPFHNVKPSKFNMNDFKRIYCNENKCVSIKYFWENFDAENYSIWFCEYLYPDQLTLTFRSCNLIEGMFQRSYSMHKNAFASVCLFGEDYNSTISGIWVWRGHELAFTLSPDWQVDYESYSWKKLDPSSEETKKLVNEYFTWSGEFGGKKFNQGKIFK